MLEWQLNRCPQALHFVAFDLFGTNCEHGQAMLSSEAPVQITGIEGMVRLRLVLLVEWGRVEEEKAERGNRVERERTGEGRKRRSRGRGMSGFNRPTRPRHGMRRWEASSSHYTYTHHRHEPFYNGSPSSSYPSHNTGFYPAKDWEGFTKPA
jgi:hypothetical protein